MAKVREYERTSLSLTSYTLSPLSRLQQSLSRWFAKVVLIVQSSINICVWWGEEHCLAPSAEPPERVIPCGTCPLLWDELLLKLAPIAVPFCMVCLLPKNIPMALSLLKIQSFANCLFLPLILGPISNK